MTSKRRKKRSTKLSEIDGWMQEFQEETDRATAILGSALIDARLEELLREFFVDDHSEVDELFNPLMYSG